MRKFISICLIIFLWLYAGNIQFFTGAATIWTCFPIIIGISSVAATTIFLTSLLFGFFVYDTKGIKFLLKDSLWLGISIGFVFAPLGILLNKYFENLPYGFRSVWTVHLIGYLLLTLFSFLVVPPVDKIISEKKLSNSLIVARFISLGIAMIGYVIYFTYRLK